MASLNETNKQLEEARSNVAKLTEELKKMPAFGEMAMFRNLKLTALTEAKNEVAELEKKVKDLAKAEEKAAENMKFFSEMSKIENKHIKPKVDTSEITKAEKEISKISEKPVEVTVKPKVDTSEISKISEKPVEVSIKASVDNIKASTKSNEQTSFQQTEASLKKSLYDNMKYVDELSKMLNSLHSYISSSGDSSKSKNIVDYFSNERTSGSLLPYGVIANEVTDGKSKSLEFSIDEKKVVELGKEYELAVKEFVEFINTFSAQNKILNKSALNEVAPDRFVNKNTGEVFDNFKKYIGISQTKPSFGIDGVDYKKVQTALGNQYLYQKEIPENATIYRGDAATNTSGMGLYSKTVSERLYGYTDATGEHLGYKDSVSKLNDTTLGLLESFGKLAAFIPAISDNADAFNAMLFPESEISAVGQDIFKRLTYDKKYSSMDYEGDIQSPSDVGLSDTLALSDFKKSSVDILKALEQNGVKLPEIDEDSSIKNSNITNMVVAQTTGEWAKMLNQVDESKFKQDNYSQLSEEEKKAADVISRFRANLETSTNIVKDTAGQTQQELAKEATVPQSTFSAYYNNNKGSGRSGGTLALNEARSSVSEYDKDLADIDARIDEIEKIFSKGDLVGLTTPREFDTQDPITEVTNKISELSGKLVTFAQGPLSRDSQKADGNGNKIFDADKYVSKLNEYGNRLSVLAQSDKFEIMQSSEGLKDIDTAIKNVERIEQEKKQASTKDKLATSLISSSLKQFSLEKELVAREGASSSGLLNGTELDKNNSKIVEIKNTLESLKKTISETTEEANKHNIPLNNEVKLVDNLKASYVEVAKSVGSLSETDKIFGRLSSAKSVAEINAIISEVERLKHLLGDEAFANSILNGSAYSSMVMAGGFENSLIGKKVSTDKLRGDELSAAKYNNQIYNQLIQNTRELQTGVKNPFAETFNTISVDVLKDGIQKTADSLKLVSDKIAELEATGSIGSEIVAYKDKIRNLQTALDEVTGNITKSSSAGDLRVAFDKAKVLGNTIANLNDKIAVVEAGNRDKQASEMYNAKFNHIKNYVKEQETLTGNKMPLQAQLEYYKNALKQFEQNSNEYYAILLMQKDVENSIRDQQAVARQKAIDLEIKQVEESIKAEEDAAKRKQEALAKELEATKKYVADQNVLRAEMGQKPMSNQEKIDYYTSQLSKFEQGTKEYIEVLKLRQQVEQDVLNTAKQQVEGTLNSIKKLASGVNNAVNKIISIIRQGIQIITRVINGAIRFVTSLGRTVTNIIKLFGNLGNRIRQAFTGGAGSTNIFKNSITELNSKLTLLKNIFNAVFNNQFINKGKNLLTSIATLNTVIGEELTDNTIAWAQELERALGISANDLIADLKEISAVLYGLGMSSEDTALGAQNLGMLSRYLGMMGLAGGNVDQVMTKLASGMKGMTQAIDDLGLSVRDSQMQSFIKNLKNGTNELGKSLKEQGVDLSAMGDDFSSLNEQARVYIRYSALITQFKENYDLKDFAKQLNTTTGRLSILSQTWSNLATTIGVAFTKVGAYLAGFIIPIIKRLETYIKGVLVNIQSLLNRVGSFFGIDIDLGLDEKLSSSSNSLDTSGVDNLNNSLDKTNEELEKVEENAKKASGSLQSFDRVNNISSNKDSGDDSDFDYSILMNSALDSLEEYTKEAENYFDILDKNLTDTIGKIKDKFKEIIGEDNLEDITKFFDGIAQAFRVLFGKQTLDDLVYMNSEDTIWAKFLRILDDIPNKVNQAKEMIGELFDVVFGDANGLNTILEMNSGSTWGDILSIIKSLKDIFGQLLVSLVDFVKTDVLTWLQEKLKELADWLVENKDKVVELIDKIVNISWDAFKIFVDLVGKLIDFVVNNPGAVVGFFAGLLALKAGSWFADTAANIGLMIIGLKEVSGLLTGGALAQLLGIGGTTAGATAGGGIGALLSGIGAYAGPIAIVAAIIVALVAAIVDLWKTSETFRDGIKEIFGKVKDSFADAFGGIKDAFENIKVAFSNFYDSYESSGLKQLLEIILLGVFDQLGRAIKLIIDVIGSLLETIINLFADLMNVISGIVDVVKGVVDIIIGIITLDGEKIKQGFKQVWVGLTEIFSGILQGIVDIFKGFGDVLFDIVNYITDGMASGLKEGWDNILEKARDFFDNLIQTVKDLLGIKSPSRVFADIGVNIVQGLLNGITNTWNTLTSKVSELCNNLVSGIRSSIKTGWENITTWVDEQKNALTSGWNNFTGYVSSGWNNLTGRTSATTGRSIFGYATGGNIAGGQLFVANENGQPELIGKISGRSGTTVANNGMIVEAMKAGVFEAVYNANAEIANQTRSTGNGAGTANIKIDGFGLIDQSTLRELARMLAPYISSNSKNIADINFTI